MKRIICFLMTLLIFAGCDKLCPAGCDTEEFVAKRGVNISHWLSQSERRGDKRVAWFKREDVKFIAEAGFTVHCITVELEFHNICNHRN